MNTEDLAIFTEIYRTRSVSAAASNLFQSQSTVSKRLASLEKELNCVLFHRGRGLSEVKVTMAGERLHPIARQILSLCGDAEEICRQSRQQKIRIAAVDSIGSYYLRDFFAELTSAKPEWEIELVMSDSRQICEMVRDGGADAGITNGEAFFPELQVREILSEKFLVYSRNPDLLNSPSVELSELNPFSEVFHVYGSEYNQWHRSVIREGSAKGKVNLIHMALDLCQKEEDWVLMPASVAEVLIGDRRYLHELRHKGLRRKGYLITPRRGAGKELLEEFTGMLLAWQERKEKTQAQKTGAARGTARSREQAGGPAQTPGGGRSIH